MSSKEYTVKEVKDALSKFKDADVVIVKGKSNGSFSHRINSIEYGKHKTTEGKVCINGRPY